MNAVDVTGNLLQIAPAASQYLFTAEQGAEKVLREITADMVSKSKPASSRCFSAEGLEKTETTRNGWNA